MKTTEENNRLIAEFMGFKMINSLQISTPNGGGIFLSELKYHTSWDWLMSVVEKIENLGFIFKMQGNATTFLKKGTFNTRIWNDDFIGDTKIKAIYNAVVEFIEWYNEQKQ